MKDTITFSEEQTMLLETADDFCRNHYPIEKVRASLDAEDIDGATWQEMAELGWLGINVPAEFGGLELGLASVVPIVESMGKNLMATPYVSTVLVAETLVTAGSPEQKAEWLPKIVGGAIGGLAVTEPDGSWKLDEIVATGQENGNALSLTGEKCFVTDADKADLVVATVNIDGVARLVVITAEQLSKGALQREAVIDQTRRSYRLTLDGIEIDTSQVLPGKEFKSIELAAMLLLTAEISGGLVAVIHTIVEYLNARKAFDRYIGSYQALKHPTVDILLGLEGAKSHLYHAATMLSEGDDEDKEIAIRMAKAQACEVFAFAGDRAVQFHGGFGFTHECDAQLYLRRALWCQYQFGDEKYQRQLLAPLLLDK